MTVDANETIDAVVVGGGIAGLAAAWELRDRNVLLLEASDRIGGRIRSERRGDVWLNFGAHVFAGPGSASDRLLSEAGVSAPSVPGRLAAVSLNGKIVSSGGVETFPFRLPMPNASRIALARVGIRLRLAVRRYAKIAEPIPGEDPAERQLRMLRFMDDRSFVDFSGALPEDVDLLFRSTLTRSSGEPEELAAGYGIGYFHLVWNRSAGLSRNILGGSGQFPDALGRGLGDRVHLGARVTAVRADTGGVHVTWVEQGVEREARANAAIVATPAFVTREIVADLPADTAAALEAIPYGPYVVGAFLTAERTAMPWDDLYALATPKRSFSMLFNTANILRTAGAPRLPGGSLMVYAAAGFARRLADLDDAAVAECFQDDLATLYPESRSIVSEVVIRRWERGLPYPRVGRSRLQAALTQPLGPIHLAGDYLGTWYTETAIQTAVAAAAAIRRGS
jgi:protoporphyrinogen/coproporphyrinogen III oxidase